MQLTVQINRFHDGRYIVHRLPMAGYSGYFSAWANKDGTLIDCEQNRVGRFGETFYDIKQYSKQWYAVATEVKRFAK